MIAEWAAELARWRALAAGSSRCDNESTMAHAVDSLDTAREAAERHAWRDAYDAYAAAVVERLAPHDLGKVPPAAWWNGGRGHAIRVCERPYARLPGRPGQIPGGPP